jgi:hypothetical protein
MKGQCTLDMKNNKVESLKGHNSIEADDDVISKTAVWEYPLLANDGFG